MEKIFTEFFTTYKEKVSSPLIRYFSLSWLLWNYKITYFILFQDQKIFFDVYKLTKYDYLVNYNFYEPWYIWLLFWLFLPLLSALFFIYIFPILNNKILDYYISNIDKENNIKQKHRKSLKKRDLEIAKMELEEKETEVKIVKEKVEKSKTEKEKENAETIKFKKEYKEFKNSPSYKVFNKIIEIINFNKWSFSNSEVPYIIPKNIISYLIVNNIIKPGLGLKSPHIFTEKWKYFAKLYFEENNKLWYEI